MRAHWPAIERVADALSARGELTGDQIDRLIGRRATSCSMPVKVIAWGDVTLQVRPLNVWQLG